MEKLLYTVSEVQELTSLGRTKIYQLLQTPGGLESCRVGRAIRIPAKALEDWVEKQAQATPVGS